MCLHGRDPHQALVLPLSKGLEDSRSACQVWGRDRRALSVFQPAPEHGGRGEALFIALQTVVRAQLQWSRPGGGLSLVSGLEASAGGGERAGQGYQPHLSPSSPVMSTSRGTTCIDCPATGTPGSPGSRDGPSLGQCVELRGAAVDFLCSMRGPAWLSGPKSRGRMDRHRQLLEATSFSQGDAAASPSRLG